jgi:hypothetical protein
VSSDGGARAELRRRRTAARGTVDGELGNGEGTREREGKLEEGEREGARPFVERGEERESRRGERESGRPSMAPLGRERGEEGERVTVVSGAGSERAWSGSSADAERGRAQTRRGARRRLAATAGRRREGERTVARVGPTCKGERGEGRGAHAWAPNGPVSAGFGRLGF